MSQRRSLLTDQRRRRAERLGRPIRRWTDSQRALFESPYRLTVAWGANGLGKSLAIAELTRRALAGALYWQRPGPQTVILCGNTWSQIGSTLRYFWEGLDRSWFKESIRYEGGGLKGQRLAVFDIVGGPGAGGELRCGTFRAENLAGPRADVVITDEPLPGDVYAELWPRLLGRNGRMYQTFTPTLGTSEDLSYLWEQVDDPSRPWAGQIRTELTLEAVTPRGGLVDLPWMDQDEIDQFESGLSGVEAEMRMGRSRRPRLHEAYFKCWGPHCLSDAPPPEGSRVGIGIDHGSKPGAQRISLIVVSGHSLSSQAWVWDHVKGDGRTETQQDAQALLELLARNGLTIADVDLWVGDRAHHGDRRGGRKSNDRLKSAIAQAIGLDIHRRGWSERLPSPLRYMQTPRKYDRSAWEGFEIIHRMMLPAEAPRFHVHPRCSAVVEDLERWQGSTRDPHKDGLDSIRYALVPMVEGTRR